MAHSRKSLHILGYPNSMIPLHSKGEFLWQFNVTGNNNPYLGLHINCLLILPKFNKIWGFFIYSTFKLQQFLHLTGLDPFNIQNCHINMPTKFHRHLPNHTIFNEACLYLEHFGTEHYIFVMHGVTLESPNVI